MTSRATRTWLVIAIAEAAGIVLLLQALAAAPAAAENNAPLPPAAGNPAAVAPRSSTTAEAAPDQAATTTATPPTAPTTATPATPATNDLGTLLLGTLQWPPGVDPNHLQVALYAGEATKALLTASLSGDQNFAFPGLDAGDYRLTTRGDGTRPFERWITIPPGADVVRVDLPLIASWIVKVALLAPDGKPLAEALKGQPQLTGAGFDGPVQVVASWQPLPAQLPFSDQRQTPFTVGQWTSARGLPGRGNSDLPARFAGTLELRQDQPAVIAAVLRECVLTQVPVEVGQQEVTLTVDPAQMRAKLASVRLQIVDATTHAPIADAKVGLNDTQSWRQPTAVGQDGVLLQERLLPGRYQLTVQVAGRVAPPLTVDLVPGRLTDLGQIPVAAPFVLCATVTGGDDGAELNVTLQPLDAVEVPGTGRRSLRSGVQQRELKAELWPGRYRLRITGKGLGAAREFDTRQLGDAALAIELQTEPELQLDSTQLADPAQLALTDGRGVVWSDRWITWQSRWNQQLPPGDYRWSLRGLDGNERGGAVTVAATGGKLVLQ
ncbi:MAG: hypothetical protein K8J09_02050 [Planctomycetes bacterium]|nr:hypothetical protein [Planctomycetota bacterium]